MRSVSDHVIDTNVLLVASAAHPGSPFKETHLPAEQREVVFEWVAAFRNDKRRLVLDGQFAIYEEYRRKLTDQDFGLLVVLEKMRTAWMRQVEISYEGDGTAIVPEEFSALDRSDRKFLAVALADAGSSTIINATDPDWFAIEGPCERRGVVVEQLLGAWLRKRK